MRFSYLVVTAIVFFLSARHLQGQSATQAVAKPRSDAVAFAQGNASTQFFPLGQVRPGLKGVGCTIFEGHQVQEFQVRILGVLKNAIAPKHDVILARLSGGPLAKTGVVAGMSGSPVYVDGKLLGAVALAFPFSKEPLAGITPIQYMLEVVPKHQAAPAHPSERGHPPLIAPYHLVSTTAGSESALRLIPQTPLGEGFIRQLEKSFPGADSEGPFTGMELPLHFGGFSTQAMDAYTPLFERLGCERMQGGVLSGRGNAPSSKNGPQPGSMISLMLVRGDMNLNVDCTVTLRQGNTLYACGHRFMMTGPAEIPFAEASVLTVVPSLTTSFKIDAPGPVEGTIRQDRFGAIYGVVGEKAPTIPVHVQIQSTLHRPEDYHFRIIQQSFLSPLLLNLTVVSALTSTERAIGPSTFRIHGAIRLSNGESVNLDNVISGDTATTNLVGATVSMPLTYLLESDFPNMKIKGVEMNIASSNQKRVATLQQVWSSKPEVRPGDHIVLTGLLRTPSGKTLTEQIPVVIPESTTDKMVSLVVGSGSVLNMVENRLAPIEAGPRNLHQLVYALNRMRRDNRLYVLVTSPQPSLTIEGEDYPSPPPSLMQTFLANPAVSTGFMFNGTSVIGDFETPPTRYSIQGMKTLQLKVDTSGV
jgi:hypothetical protein